MTTNDLRPDEVAEPEAAGVVFPTRPAAAERMADLDFLLGDFRCDYTNLTTDPASTGVASWNTRSILNGHYYEMTQTVPVPGVSSRWVFGWSEVDSSFFSVYYDDWGNHGRTTCAGWEDGLLKCTGEYFAFGQSLVFQEVFARVDADHYTKSGFVQQGDIWVPIDLIECYRV